jgi:hypothetical protein
MTSNKQLVSVPEEPQDDLRPLVDGASNGELILAIVLDLLAKQNRLSRYIDQHLGDDGTPLPELARLLAIHSQNASRLGRLLRDKRVLSDGAADAMTAAIDQALDELSAEWDIEL